MARKGTPKKRARRKTVHDPGRNNRRGIIKDSGAVVVCVAWTATKQAMEEQKEGKSNPQVITLLAVIVITQASDILLH